MKSTRAFVMILVCGMLAACASLDDDEVGVVEAASVCGTTSDFVEVESAGYPDMWRRLSTPVALLQTRFGWPYRACTGFLVTDDIMVTERSCFASAGTGSSASSWQVIFDYQHDQWGTERPYEEFDIAAVLEPGSDSLQYTLLRVAPRADGTKPGAIYGTLPLEPMSSPELNATVHIIQHPAGLRKQLASGPATSKLPSTLFFNHRVDTQETTFQRGSLGAPILRLTSPLTSNPSTMDVVGMHLAEGCDGLSPETGSNRAASARLLYDSSPILRRLVGVRAAPHASIPTARVQLSTTTQSCTRDGDWTAARLGCALDPTPGQYITVSCSEAQSGVTTTQIQAGGYGTYTPACTTAWDPAAGANRTTCTAWFKYNSITGGVSARCVFL